ncbi:MAG: ribonuclease P protein component, partial [Gemmatimonadaceae bacterium]
DRNRLKRRLRELVRVYVLPLGIPADLVIWAQRQAYAVTFAELRQALASIIERLPRPAQSEG